MPTIFSPQENASNLPDGAIEVEVLTGPPDARWDTFVNSTSRTSLYHHSAWQAMIAEVFGHETYYLMAIEPHSNCAAGVLPLVRVRSRLFGDYMVSMPYFNYGGAVATHPWIETLLMQEACKVAEKIGVTHVEFRDNVPRDGPWIVRGDKITMLLELPDSVEKLWQRLGPKLRAQIKRPERENAETMTGGVELLNEFYKVFSRNMRDLGTPVYPRSFFATIFRTAPETSRIVLVRLRGEPAAAGFLIGSGTRIEVPWASSVRKFNPMGVNMLLYWEMLRVGIEKKYTLFDFGRCTEHSGSHRFKKQWKAVQQRLYWHYWVREGVDMPDLSPQNPKYALAIRAWQRLPLFVANWIGPRIVKNLP